MADSRQIEIEVSNLLSKKQDIQGKIRQYKEQLNSIKEKIYDLEEVSQDIDHDIAEIRIRAEKESDRDDTKEDPNNRNPLAEEGEGGPSVGDGATSTASLDGASQSTGGDYGGWRHYSKIGQVLKRPRHDDDKKGGPDRNEDVDDRRKYENRPGS